MNQQGGLHQLTLSSLCLILAVAPAGRGWAGNDSQRAVQLLGPAIFQGQTGTATIQLQAQGNENGVGFSLAFDPTVLTYLGASLGADASTASLNINADHATSGQLGIILVLPVGISFSPGIRQLLKVNFEAVNAASVDSAVTFTDKPVKREVADTDAIAVVSTYIDGTISVNPKPPSVPTVTLSPPGGIVAFGGSVTLTATGQGTAPLSYQWMFNGAPIGGATSSTYHIDKAQTSHSGGYAVIVSNAIGSSTNTSPALLAILSWSNPANVTYGTPLSLNQFNATVTVPGNFSYTPAAGALLNAGTHTLSVVFTPADTLDYSSFTNTVGLVVSPAPLSISSGLTAEDKLYDATIAATLSSNEVVLAGIVAADSAAVSLVTNGYIAGFATAKIGNNIAVSVSGLMLTGSAAENYTLAQPAGLTAAIRPRPLTVTAASNITTYDATTDAAAIPVITSGALQGQDSVSFFESYDNKNVGGGKTLTPSGTVSDGNAGSNYSLSFINSAGAIMPRPLLVTATALNKIYDGNKLATVSVADNRVPGDNLTESYSSAAFADKNVGTARLVTINGIALSGSDAGNYSFNTTTTTTADISPALLAITANDANKTYGQTVSFSGKEFTAVGLTSSDTVDTVSLSSDGAAATTPVADSPYTILIGAATGSGLANYNASYHHGLLAVGRAALVATAFDTNRPYGTPNPPFNGSLSDLQNSDNLTLSFACSATNSSPPGRYDIIPIIQDPDGKLPNYLVTAVNGNLTVQPLLARMTTTLLPGPTLLLSVQTVSGARYLLQSKNDLMSPTWNTAQTYTGNGGILTFTNPVGSNLAGFYRIAVQ